MEDTESSDFLSSSDSLCSSLSHGTTSTDQDGFDVFLSDGLTEAAKAEEDFDNVRMIPNSRLSSADHPVLIRLENEYQARRSMWHRHPEQYCQYNQEVEGRTTCSNKNKPVNSRMTKADHPVLIRLENEYQSRRSTWQHHTGPYCRYSQEVEGRTSCPSKNKLASRGSPLHNGYRDFAFPDGNNLEVPHGLKRQQSQDAKSPLSWWREKEQNLLLSDGDRIFAQKCRELQGFIKPLTELLNGLKRGRYDRGLSSFQQSLAMDRIQRIVGVLQNPEMGERYLSTLLQVEMMLKVWFPSVTSSSSSSSSSLEMDTDQPQNKMAKHPDVGSVEQQRCQIEPPRCLRRDTRSRPSESLSMASVYSDYSKEGVQWPTLNLTWMHTSPICNPPLSQVDIHHLNTAFGQDLLRPIGSSCGIIFLVQNSQASTTPTTVSGGSEERSLDGTSEQHGPRSQSAPPIIVHSDSPNLGKLKNHSYSFPYLSACMQTSGGENT